MKTHNQLIYIILRNSTLIFILLKSFSSFAAAGYISFTPEQSIFTISAPGQSSQILVSSNEFKGVITAVNNLYSDLSKVTGRSPEVTFDTIPQGGQLVIVGTIGKSTLIDQLIKMNKIDVGKIKGVWEGFCIQVVENPFDGINKALVIAGSDKRGTIFGVYHLAEQCGVSPWYWWADVPIASHEAIYCTQKIVYDAPKVKYRGIFLNDEAPALSGWAYEKFGGFNHQFYSHVFELILRLKGNFLWPAMWGKSMFDDDPLSAPLADEMGIVIGTSHHEPMCRAQVEWHRYGKGPWDYSKNEKTLTEFWTNGFEQNKNFEKLVTIGMRGDGDEPMSEESNIALLEKIVRDQRKIISKLTSKKPEETPQVWALYKEVQDYYDKGMRVPKDVTLLLCDDNWGNIRKLPDLNTPVHPGGFGMYYHVDYVGGPRSYKWINVSQIQRIWEQMNLAWSHKVDRIWILNVGDLKPMEFPASFFLDMAWDPTRFNAQNLFEYTQQWCEQQFGGHFDLQAAQLLNKYTKYNHRITPELLNDKIYSLANYNEFESVCNDYRQLAFDALRIYNLMPQNYKDAFDQLVLFPINATCNLYEMYYAVAKNQALAADNNPEANYWANVVDECFERDSLLTLHYNRQITNGKWPHMMDQVRIGYTTWADPPHSIKPKTVRVNVPVKENTAMVFIESDGYVSIEAENFQKSSGSGNISWEIIPDLGKTQSGITTMPANQYPSVSDSVFVEYRIRFVSTGLFNIHVYLSPTLNFNSNKGLRYAIAFDNNREQIVNINQSYTVAQMEKWQAARINETVTKHEISTPGLHTLRFRVLEPGIVLQKIVIDTGGLQPSYLGPPQSKMEVNSVE